MNTEQNNSISEYMIPKVVTGIGLIDVGTMAVANAFAEVPDAYNHLMATIGTHSLVAAGVSTLAVYAMKRK